MDSLRLAHGTHSHVTSGGDDEDDESSAASSDLEAGGDLRPLVSGRDRLQQDRAALMGQARIAAAAEKAAAAKAAKPSQQKNASTTGSDIEAVDSSLDRTAKALADTERFGQLTTAQLLMQRESFLKQRAQLTTTDEYLSRTKNLLTRMQFRLVTDKIVQGVVIMVELAAIGAIIYFKYYA